MIVVIIYSKGSRLVVNDSNTWEREHLTLNVVNTGKHSNKKINGHRMARVIWRCGRNVNEKKGERM